MPWFDCIDCGTEFHREHDETWKVRCLGCWRRNKERDNFEPFYKAKLWSLERENEHLRNNLANLHNHIRFMIMACHPDRNQGKEIEAGEVTKWLLTIRNELPRY